MMMLLFKFQIFQKPSEENRTWWNRSSRHWKAWWWVSTTSASFHFQEWNISIRVMPKKHKFHSLISWTDKWKRWMTSTRETRSTCCERWKWNRKRIWNSNGLIRTFCIRLLLMKMRVRTSVFPRRFETSKNWATKNDSYSETAIFLSSLKKTFHLFLKGTRTDWRGH